VLTVTGASGVAGTAEQLIQVGIPLPTLRFQTPPPEVQNLVVPQGANIWVQTVFTVDPSATYTLTAGLDPDRNATNNNDIRLGTRLDNTFLNTTDLDLRIPTPLELTTNGLPVPTGTYYLWAEVHTDQTAPVRVYAAATIHVLRPYTQEINASTPVLPAVTGEQWQIVASPSTNRQIVDIGALNRGDQLYLSLLTVPGYSVTYNLPGFSVMLVDNLLGVYTWIYDGRMLFTPYTKLIIGTQSQSPHYYLVLDSTGTDLTPSAQLRIARGVAATYVPPRQAVYLNFAGTQGALISVGGTHGFTLGAYTAPAGMDTTTLRAAILARLQTLFAPYSITVLSSDVDPEPTGPHTVVYFENATQLDATDMIPADVLVRAFGLSDFVDPRNQTVSGNALVRARKLEAAFPALATEAALGTALGNAAAHQLGFLFGLAETTGVVTDVMNVAVSVDRNDLVYTVAPLAPLFTEPQPFPSGVQQDAPRTLTEVLR
jgi:hypothetical protein